MRRVAGVVVVGEMIVRKFLRGSSLAVCVATSGYDGESSVSDSLTHAVGIEGSSSNARTL